jgi:hypothetical protein
MPSKKHEDIAHKLAGRLKSTYNPSQGVDIKTKDKAVEVEVLPTTIDHGLAQLRRSRKEKKYLAVPPELRDQALRKAKGTGIGVMLPSGEIVKRSKRKP